ncbi:hypothetical protein CSAL01_12731 [Colletotrichum salicis]|uniref:Uncharacterized protein n=1 Tax=Colletotrichum salicis TaxID=1209931 RepID=A0A135V0E8_9PEZI|nr:hypothetical protein CSAL01_12731 [Colletotrichum salicis]
MAIKAYSTLARAMQVSGPEATAEVGIDALLGVAKGGCISLLRLMKLSSVSCHIFKVVPVLWEKLQRSGIERRTTGQGPPSQLKSAAASCKAGIVQQRLRPVRTISDHILASLKSSALRRHI